MLAILTQIATLKGIDAEYYTRFFSIAMKNISWDHYRKAKASASTALIKLFTQSVELACQCARSKDGGQKSVTLGSSPNLNGPSTPGKWEKTVKPNQFAIDLFATLSSILKQASSPQNQTKDDSKDGKKDDGETDSALIRGIEQLCIEFVDFSENGAKVILLFIENVNTEKRDEAINAICNILRNDFQKNAFFGPQRVINSVAQNIFHSRQNENHAVNLMRINFLQRLACVLNNPAVTDLILSVLTDEFLYLQRKQKFGELSDLSNALASVACLGHGKSFSRIVDMIFGLYQNPFKENDKSLGTMVFLQYATKN